MSSCLSGGGSAYAVDLEIIKYPSTSTSRTSHTSSSPSPSPSPSSTPSEASNSPLAISTRKPRTPRKRPNQIYNEAAALLSTAYPNIFSTINFTNPPKFTKTQHSFFHKSSELLLPFRVIDDSDSGFLLQTQPIREKPSCLIESKVVNLCNKSWQSNSSTSGEVNSHGGGRSMEMEFSTEFQEDFDAESILDEEIEEGIDSIMGKLSVNQNTWDESSGRCQGAQISQFTQLGSWYANPVGSGLGGKYELGLGFGLRRGVRALRHVEEGNWWNFSTLDVLRISPKTNTKGKATTTTSRAEKKKKKKQVEKPSVAVQAKSWEMPKGNPNPKPKPVPGLQLKLKLNYDEVVNAWSDANGGSPFSEELTVPGYDVYARARLAEIDLLSESEGGGVRGSSVLRYKEKRRTRHFSSKIRYQVRKITADRRLGMKGRFVRKPSSSSIIEEM